MVDKTIMNREQFIRKMIEGKTITGSAAGTASPNGTDDEGCAVQYPEDLRYALLSRPIDEELLRKTLEDINTCVQEVMARCLPPEERRADTHEIRPHRPGPDRVR